MPALAKMSIPGSEMVGGIEGLEQRTVDVAVLVFGKGKECEEGVPGGYVGLEVAQVGVLNGRFVHIS
jgi:hypothetical protein